MTITIPSINIETVIPECFLAVVALIILIKDAFSPSGKKYSGALAALGITGTFVLVSISWGSNVLSFNDMWLTDNFSAYFKLAILYCAALTIFASMAYEKHHFMASSEYYTLLLFTTIGMMLMCSGADFIILFLGIELMSICLYVLTGIFRGSLAVEASYKYFLMSSFSTAIFLYGVALIYGAAGTTNLIAINSALSANQPSNALMIICIILIVTGIGLKLASAPFYMWAPDAYEGAPLPVASFIAGGTRAAFFSVFIKIFIYVFPLMIYQWEELFSVIAILTMVVGNLAALQQENIKRMLAYSGIAHCGFMMIGLVSGGTTGLTSLLFYIPVYICMNSGAFLMATVVAGKKEERLMVSEYGGLWQESPISAGLLTFFLLSLAGIPPMAGFTGKFYILSTALLSEFTWLTVTAFLSCILSSYYYIRITAIMFMRPPNAAHSPVTITGPIVIGIIGAVAGVVAMGLHPSYFFSLANASLP